VDDRRPELRLDIIADYRHTRASEALGPVRIARNEDGDVVDECNSGFKRTFGIELRRRL